MKRTSYKTGLNAEALCRLALRLKFYRIVSSRYKSPLGEIDIIAMRGKILAMIEVKARPSTREAIEAILPKQRQRLERGALDFLARHPQFNQHDVRFDVMLVLPRRWPLHMLNAWRPEA